MGGSESDKPTKEKEPKAAPSTAQEPSATTSTPSPAVTPDWSGFQAYSPMPPHGFLASSPHGRPYMWGVQPIMPPYGAAPHPYVAMYPHGGIYAHPSIPPGSYPFSPFAMPSPNGIVEATTPGSTEAEAKQSDAKEKLPIKRSKGSLGSLNMITGKNNDQGKTSGTSANGVHSKSADTGSEGSSEGSDENSPNESQPKSGGRQYSMEEVSQNGSAENAHQNGGSNTPLGTVNQSMPIVPFTAAGGVPGPTTNLNIGMDYWGTPAAPVIPAMRGKVPAAPVAAGMASAASRDSIQSQMWLQDEREFKRQRRKQSNRESARRSRLRKQAECDELAQRAEVLKEENASLRAEVSRIRGEYEQLLAERVSLKVHDRDHIPQSNVNRHIRTAATNGSDISSRLSRLEHMVADLVDIFGIVVDELKEIKKLLIVADDAPMTQPSFHSTFGGIQRSADEQSGAKRDSSPV